jgi:hypothetical protein
MDTYQPYTPYPTEVNNEYKYWGMYGPKTPARTMLAGALVVFVLIPAILIGLALLGVLLFVAIAVPPVGIALLSAGNS